MVALQIVALFATAWGGFEFGRQRAGFDSAATAQVEEALEEQLGVLVEERGQLRRQMAILQRSGQIDREAAQAAKVEIEAAEDERLRLMDEVAFYRKIVAPESRRHGLRVTEFSIEALSPGHYRYRFTVTQVHGNSKVVSGKVALSVVGTQAGEERVLTLADLPAASPNGPQPVQLKYFQNIEGEFGLPEGFIPREVSVGVQPKAEQLPPLHESFPWKISG